MIFSKRFNGENMPENRLRPILEASPVGIVVFNADKGVAYTNSAATALFGTQKIQAQGGGCGDLVACANRHSDPRGCGYSQACGRCGLFRAICGALGADGAPVHQNGEVLLKRDGDLDGLWLRYRAAPFEMDGQALAILAVDDITHTKKMQDALQESELKFRSIFDNSPSALLVGTPDGAIIDVNPTACRVFGRTAEEIKRLGRYGLMDPSDPRLAKMLEIQTRDGKARGTAIMVRADQTKFEADMTSTTFTDAAGNQKSSMIIRDMTEFHVTARKHRELEDQLHHAQRLESVGRLAGGVAHDFNNLLAVILGYTQIVLSEIGREDPHHELLEEVQQAAVRAKDLTRQLLAFSRKQILEVEPTEANKVVIGFEKLIRRVIGEDIVLKLALSPEPLPIVADTAQIEQVLMNLAVNARDAMPDGGILTIETAAVSLDDAYVAPKSGVHPGHYAMIAVSDTGCGMDQKTQASVFEPFFTTKAIDKGTGLGLATSYGIIKQHGGNIWVYSEPGNGTTFKIYLPSCGNAVHQEKQDPDLAQRLSAAAVILIVEDDPGVRKMANRILTGRGYTVIESCDVADALSRASSYEGRIDLVISDVVMPGMKGPEVFARIHRIHPEARVLYMSGYTQGAASNGRLLEEGVMFIQKPFTVRGLLKKVEDMLTDSTEQSTDTGKPGI